MLADFTRAEDSVRPWVNFSEPELMLTDDYYYIDRVLIMEIMEPPLELVIYLT